MKRSRFTARKRGTTTATYREGREREREPLRRRLLAKSPIASGIFDEPSERGQYFRGSASSHREKTAKVLSNEAEASALLDGERARRWIIYFGRGEERERAALE